MHELVLPLPRLQTMLGLQAYENSLGVTHGGTLQVAVLRARTGYF